MTIDERLEALTQSVELLLADSRLATSRIQTLAVAASKQFELHGKLQKQLDQVSESVSALVRVAEIHERRITSLEGTA
jgi:hypothetical protein